MSVPVVHVGYPKAASTTLQKHLFSKHPEIEYFGNYPTNNVGIDTSPVDVTSRYLRDENLKALYVELLKRNAADFDLERAKRLFELAVARGCISDLVPVMSHERFLSTLFWHPNLRDKANRLKALLPNAKVLIIVRNQHDMVVSQYQNQPFDPRDLHRGKPMSFARWLRVVFRYDDQIEYLRSLRYSDVIRMYEELFGGANVKVLCCEDLASNTPEFCSELSQFMAIHGDEAVRILAGKRENVGVPSYVARVQRRNGRIRRIQQTGRRGSLRVVATLLVRLLHLSRGPVLTKSMERELTGYFSESNIRLQGYVGDRVMEYGYPVHCAAKTTG